MTSKFMSTPSSLLLLNGPWSWARRPVRTSEITSHSAPVVPPWRAVGRGFVAVLGGGAWTARRGAARGATVGGAEGATEGATGDAAGGTGGPAKG